MIVAGFAFCTSAAAYSPIDARSEIQVKHQVMQRSLAPAAYLAHYLGYGWVSGCSSEHVGEGYIMTDDGFRPDMSGHCDGYMGNHRTSIKFSQWDFVIKDIEFSDPVISDLQPLEIDYVIFDNRYGSEEEDVSHTFSVTTTSSVTERRIHSFNWSSQTSVQHTQKVPFLSDTKFTHTFSFGGNHTNQNDQTETEQTTTKLSTNLTLPPHSKRKVSVIANRTRSKVDYVATIEARFALTFDGFLRWGGGHTPQSNYHRDYYGSGERPTFPYTLGENGFSVGDDLMWKMDYNIYPWDWHRLRRDHGDVIEWVTNQFTNDKIFTFQVRGQLTRVDGQQVDIKYYPIEYAD